MEGNGEKVEIILKVLALFDEEDIPYIHSSKIDDSMKEDIKNKVKVKTLGGRHDGQRK